MPLLHLGSTGPCAQQYCESLGRLRELSFLGETVWEGKLCSFHYYKLQESCWRFSSFGDLHASIAKLRAAQNAKPWWSRRRTYAEELRISELGVLQALPAFRDEIERFLVDDVWQE